MINRLTSLAVAVAACGGSTTPSQLAATPTSAPAAPAAAPAAPTTAPAPAAPTTASATAAVIAVIPIRSVHAFRPVTPIADGELGMIIIVLGAIQGRPDELAVGITFLFERPLGWQRIDCIFHGTTIRHIF